MIKILYYAYYRINAWLNAEVHYEMYIANKADFNYTSTMLPVFSRNSG